MSHGIINMAIIILVNATSVPTLPVNLCWSVMTLQWCHYECEGISNQQHLACLLNRLFRRRLKKTSKLHVTGLSEGNPPVNGGLPSQRAWKMFLFDHIIMKLSVSHVCAISIFKIKWYYITFITFMLKKISKFHFEKVIQWGLGSFRQW